MARLEVKSIDVEETVREMPAYMDRLKQAVDKNDEHEVQKLTGEAAGRILEKAKQRALEGDKWCYRSAIWALSSVMVIVTGGAIALALTQTKVDIPDILVAIGSAAVGALAGLIAPRGAQAAE